MNNQQLPAEGIYFKMPADEYFALPYFSRSKFDLTSSQITT